MSTFLPVYYANLFGFLPVFVVANFIIYPLLKQGKFDENKGELVSSAYNNN